MYMPTSILLSSTSVERVTSHAEEFARRDPPPAGRMRILLRIQVSSEASDGVIAIRMIDSNAICD
jgi:hypothetical protein